MAVQSLYDLSPLASLLLGGAALALLPLAWVAYQQRRATALRRVHSLTLLTLFLTFDLLMFGAFTRLTDSGLGCPDWPGCYGSASPVGAHADIAVAQSAMPSGPVTHGKAWVEMIHRYLATSVGVLIVVLTVLAWLDQRAAMRSAQVPRINPWWPTFTLLWICLQGAFGAWTVTMKLFPAIVALHLLAGLALLVLLCVQAVRLSPVGGERQRIDMSVGLRWLLRMSFAAVLLQVALGAWVSTNYAVLACADFPRCQGSWWPLMNFEQGFTLWRELGLTSFGAPIDFAALTAIHYVHRMAAPIALALLGVLAWRLNHVLALRRQSRWIAFLTGAQLATGVSTIVFDWPLLGAVLHTGGAGALVMVLTWTAVASHATKHRVLPVASERPVARVPA